MGIVKNAIESSLKKHTFTQHSFIDKDGKNHWEPLINELYELRVDEETQINNINTARGNIEIEFSRMFAEILNIVDIAVEGDKGKKMSDLIGGRLRNARRNVMTDIDFLYPEDFQKQLPPVGNGIATLDGSLPIES